MKPQPRPSRSQVRRARRRQARLRRTGVLALGLVALIILTVVAFRAGGDDAPEVAVPPASPTPATESVAAAPPPSPTPSPTPSVVEKGTGEWSYASGEGTLHGAAGQLMRFHVAVEKGIDQDAEAFAGHVEAVFADERGWTAGREWRLQRVPREDRADFTIYLASPRTRAELCGADDTYTSCRNGDKVVINLARWLLGVPDYGATMDVYREYVINHESGHALGHGHELCPGKGDLAPVMQQQTLGLHGCEANAWPYPDKGKGYYGGPPGEYGDSIP